MKNEKWAAKFPDKVAAWNGVRLGVVFLLCLAGCSDWGTRGIKVTIANKTSESLKDVSVSYRGGSWKFGEVPLGAQVTFVAKP